MKAVFTALGLPESATEAEAVLAIGKLSTALNAYTPPLDKFVPRPDYDLALNRATAAEGQLAAQAKASHDARVAAALDGAVKAGKVSPATKDFYLATCATADGLAAFEKFAAAAPTIFGETDIGRGDPAGKTALNAEQKAVALALGVSEQDYLAHLAAKAAKAA